MVGQSGHSVQIQQLYSHDPLRFCVWVAQLDLFSPMKFEHHQLYSFSKMEDQNIALCAVYYSRTRDCINPHNLAIFDGFEKRIAVP